jgi:hypothetical protein
MVKHARGDARFVTHGSHVCDEPEVIAEYEARARESGEETATQTEPARPPVGEDRRPSET